MNTTNTIQALVSYRKRPENEGNLQWLATLDAIIRTAKLRKYSSSELVAYLQGLVDAKAIPVSYAHDIACALGAVRHRWYTPGQRRDDGR